MVSLNRIEAYQDNNGNVIYSESTYEGSSVTFRGKNNVLRILPGAKLAQMIIDFDCDDGYCEIGSNSIGTPFKAACRIGLGSKIIIGKNVTCTFRCTITAVEKADVRIGDDCMLSSGNEIRTDDAHPIFDVTTGKRLNPARSIVIGDHVWLSGRAVVFGGGEIGRGSVIGFGSFVKGKLPNNCLAVGVPARVLRRDIAWERPHLSLSKPWMKPAASSVTKSRYWEMTEVESVSQGALTRSVAGAVFQWLREFPLLLRMGKSE